MALTKVLAARRTRAVGLDKPIADMNFAALPQTYFTPVVHIDGVSLAFSGELAPGTEADLFATLLTHATFEVRTAEVVHEAYERAHARLDEERWYALAKEYFDEYKALVERGDSATLAGHLAWLDTHFFARHAGLAALREPLERFAGRARHERRDVLQDTPPSHADLTQESRVLH